MPKKHEGLKKFVMKRSILYGAFLFYEHLKKSVIYTKIDMLNLPQTVITIAAVAPYKILFKT
jgi:hypothetical protein